MVQSGKGLAAGFVAGQIHRIDEEDVLPAVVVVIDEADAAAHGLGEIFFAEGAGIVFEVNAGLGGDVGEFDGAGWANGGSGRFRNRSWLRRGGGGRKRGR